MERLKMGGMVFPGCAISVVGTVSRIIIIIITNMINVT